jgi:hypothetical protein
MRYQILPIIAVFLFICIGCSHIPHKLQTCPDQTSSTNISPADGRPPFDWERARSFLGKYVIVGLDYEDKNGNPLPEKQKEIHGVIKTADPIKGFCVQLKGKKDGEVYWLPPDLRPFKDAKPGEYRLRNTGEIIINPDLLSDWVVNKKGESK